MTALLLPSENVTLPVPDWSRCPVPSAPSSEMRVIAISSERASGSVTEMTKWMSCTVSSDAQKVGGGGSSENVAT